MTRLPGGFGEAVLMSEELPRLPERPADGHKGTFGTVCVLGGQVAPPRVMLGGPAFSALAALRCGTGLAVLAVPEPMMLPALNAAPSATGLALPVDGRGDLCPSEVAELLDRYLPEFDCLALGPGMGDGIAQQQVVVRLIAQDQVPLVIDADALNALACLPDLQRDFRAPAVLTPHPGEYRRLASSAGIDADPTEPAQRADAATQLASRLGCVVVLKGASTVVSDGIDTHVNETGNVALATAGSGDVLTGIIASLAGQFFKPSMGAGSRQITPQQQGGLSLLDCARLGVHIHGLAADRWAARHGHAGLLAADLLDELPDILRDLR
ncbi:MAG: NAD(P)H-hydrate dehydratase [Phycisphaerales bacterium]|nr:MAG: NAD(P)H-hydrate dehydratase [Phycisphaerales bacterium]